jgi:hypothetical protein
VRASKRIPTHDTASSRHEWDGLASGKSVYEEFTCDLSQLSLNKSGSIATSIVRTAGSFIIGTTLRRSIGKTEPGFPLVDVLDKTRYRC